MLTGLHIPALAVACGCILLAATLLNSRRRTARAALCVLAAASAALYFDWRFDHDGLSPFETDSARSVAEKVWAGAFLGIEILCTFELAVFLLLMSRTSDHRDLVDQYEQGLRALPPDALPPVDVWIATYNEEWPILEKTVIGALNLDYPKDKLRIYVLDDGRRNWLRDRCAEMGVVHVTRPDNRGKKAGNHNHALAVSASPFILSLDADFVPYSNFLFRVLGFFQDPKVAIVQTPQTYYNVDVVRSALRLDGSAPDELACFYREIQPSRDAWDAAFYCGSCALLRRSALEAVGGFETRTDVEDQATSVRLLAKGYVTRYLNEQLSVGLSAESLAVMHDQRNRWCRGSMQIAFLGHGPFGWGMGFIHRLLFSQTTWITWSIAPLVYAVSPMTLWMFGWKVYPAANPTEVLVIPLLLFISLSVSIAWLSRLHWTPIASPATMLFLAVELVPTALSTLIKPFGKPLVRILPVTPKGASAAARRVDLRTFSVLAAIIVLTLGSFVATALAGADPVQHPDEVVASVFWTVYTLVVLTFAALTCFERPYRRGEERFPVQQPADLRSGDQFLGVLILDISVSGARIETGGAASLRSDDRVELGVLGIGTLPGIVVRRDAPPRPVRGQVRRLGRRGQAPPDPGDLHRPRDSGAGCQLLVGSDLSRAAAALREARLRSGGGPELTGVMKRRGLPPLCAGTLLGAAADPVRDQQGARPVQNRQSGTSGLGSRAAARGVAFGTAVGSAQAAQHAPYREVVARECTLITPENEMKWHHLSARPGSYDFSGADWLADFARTNRKRLRGHTLLWHEGLPPWAEALDGWRIFEEAILRHIRTVGGRYRGQIGSWDVVNEPIRVEDGRGDGLRRQPFLDRIGPEYLALALHAARETDPSARLCINELNLEYDGPYFEDRRAALLRLVGELKAAGVPLDAVGIQSHLTVGAHPFSERRFRAFLAELASLQVEIQITELDVSDAHLPAALVERDRRVAEEYERYLTVALDERATNTVVTWGISDRYSWLNTPFAPPDKKRKDGQPSRPLPFDEGLHKKVAWEAIARAFDGAPAR